MIHVTHTGPVAVETTVRTKAGYVRRLCALTSALTVALQNNEKAARDTCEAQSHFCAQLYLAAVTSASTPHSVKEELLSTFQHAVYTHVAQQRPARQGELHLRYGTAWLQKSATALAAATNEAELSEAYTQYQGAAAEVLPRALTEFVQVHSAMLNSLNSGSEGGGGGDSATSNHDVHNSTAAGDASVTMSASLNSSGSSFNASSRSRSLSGSEKSTKGLNKRPKSDPITPLTVRADETVSQLQRTAQKLLRKQHQSHSPTVTAASFFSSLISSLKPASDTAPKDMEPSARTIQTLLEVLMATKEAYYKYIHACFACMEAFEAIARLLSQESPVSSLAISSSSSSSLAASRSPLSTLVSQLEKMRSRFDRFTHLSLFCHEYLYTSAVVEPLLRLLAARTGKPCASLPARTTRPARSVGQTDRSGNREEEEGEEDPIHGRLGEVAVALLQCMHRFFSSFVKVLDTRERVVHFAE